MELRERIDRNERGVRVDLQDGAYIVATALGLEFDRLHQELIAAHRIAKGIPEDKALNSVDAHRMFCRALLGGCVKGWGGYTEDGVPLADRDEEGNLHEANGLRLLGPGGEFSAWNAEILKLSNDARKAEETQKGN